MCEELGELRRGMERYTRALEPACLGAVAAERALEDVTAIAHMAATAKALLAARVADGGAWKREGHRSPADHIAKKTGSSVGAAIDDLKRAERLAELPGVAAAARRGELSPEQASAVAGAAAVAPAQERRLLEEAKRLPLKELRAECGRTRAAHEDREARRKKIHDERFVRSWEDAEGAGHVHARGTPEDVAAIMARINAERDEIFEQARKAGSEEPAEAYGFDALKKICTGEGASAAPAHKVIVRIDLDTLLRGYPLEDETCDVAGVPVAASAVEDIVRMGSTFLTAVIEKGKRLIGYVHLGRQPTAGQQTGLEWLYPTCAAAGCSQSARLQRDHREDWARTKVTIFDLLDLLCPFHHGLKTRKGWMLVEGTGKRAFVAPEHPRHPQHAPPAPP